MPNEAPPPRLNLDEIWAGDMLGRRTEALFLERFLVRTYKQAGLYAGDAYTISVDASYGEGKSFFLRRLQRQLSLNYPVAFIDAWADDTSDEPYTALTCALEETFEPYVKTGPIKNKWQEVKTHSRAIAKAATFGLIKRGAGLLITQKAADEIGEVIGGGGEERQDDADAVGGVLDKISDIFATKAANAFRERRQSVANFKSSLRSLIERLRDPKIKTNPPVFILVDELDRCRPTYAVKLLEEVKTLFDIPGLVFVFATHGQALQHSVKALYGQSFDSQAYLRRFFRRRYDLKRPILDGLVADWLRGTAIGEASIALPRPHSKSPPMQLSSYLSGLLRALNVSPREGHAVLDLLDNFAVMWGTRGPIHAGFLVPLAINSVLERPATTGFDGAGSPEFIDMKTGAVFNAWELFGAYLAATTENLGAYGDFRSSTIGASRYVADEMEIEYQRRHNEPEAVTSPPLHECYPSLVAELGRLAPGEDKMLS